MAKEETQISEPVRDQLWILMNLTARPFASRFAAKFHLNLTEWRILRIVARNPGATAQEVTDYSGLDKMSVSRAVRALESNGQLARHGASTGRSLQLRPTAKGLKAYQEILAMAQRRDQQIYGQLSAAEAVAFEAVLTKLIVRAREVANGDDL